MAITFTTVPGFAGPVRNADEREFNSFFNEQFRLLCLFAFRYTGQMAISEEIAGDAFVKLWERRSGFRHPLAMKSFVYIAVRFACLNFLRDSRREQLQRRQYARFCEKQERFILQEIVNREVCRDALSAVDRLPAQCRRIIQSLFIAGRSTAQVADAMRLSESTVRNQKARGFSIIRKKMEHTGNFPVDPDFIFTEL